jgi:hypothetical protein
MGRESERERERKRDRRREGEGGIDRYLLQTGFAK